MLPVPDELAGQGRACGRARTARSHRYSGGRGPAAGTHEMCIEYKNTHREAVGKIDCLGGVSALLGGETNWIGQVTIHIRNLPS